MKRSRAFLAALLLLVVAFAVVRIGTAVKFNIQRPFSPTAREAFQPAGWRVYFSPKGGSTQAIVGALDQAKESVFVQAYSFTSGAIADALVEAYKRGVRVDVILDKSQMHVKNGKFKNLVESRIPVYVDAAHAIAHNKVIIIDSSTVITGSFNFTVAAELYNAENLLVIQDKSLAARYTENWNLHRAHSLPYQEWRIRDATKRKSSSRREPQSIFSAAPA